MEKKQIKQHEKQVFGHLTDGISVEIHIQYSYFLDSVLTFIEIKRICKNSDGGYCSCFLNNFLL